MKRKNYLFWDIEQIKNLINSGDLKSSEAYLIIIHTAVHTKKEAEGLAFTLKEFFPESKIAGTSACDIIYLGKLYNDKCLISFISLKDTKAEVTLFEYEGRGSKELAVCVFQKICRPETMLMLNFFSDFYTRVPDYVDVLNNKGFKGKIIGGIVSNNSRGEPSFVFTENGICENSLLTVTFNNPKLMVYNYAITGHEPVGGYHTITKAEGNVIKEIDNIPAPDWYKDLIGCETLPDSGSPDYSEESDALLRFPMLLKNYNKASRFINYNAESDTLYQFAINYRDGQQFRIAYLSRFLYANEWEEAFENLNKNPVESMFCYSCVLRKVLFNRCAEWELKPLTVVDVCGALLYGEIGNVNGSNEFMNGACNLMTIAENKRHIVINSYPIREIFNTQDDFKKYYYHMLENQSRYIFNKNINLMDQISKQEEVLNERLFVDTSTGLENLHKLVYDNGDGIYNKGCLITIKNGDLAVSHFGINTFGKIIAKIIQSINKLMQTDYPELNTKIYNYDEYSFLIVSDINSSDEIFQKCTEKLFERYETCHIENLNYSYVNQFIVVINEENMLDKVKLAKANSKNLSDGYVKYDSSLGLEDTVEEFMHMIMVINYAIENDGIIPFFQPIFDNATGKIDKFEALMRLKDESGKIYYPGQFMETAKVQGLYPQLSRIVINKIFDLFEKREEAVSINLSAIDINSAETRAMIYERLERIGNAERFIFEILESEEFRDMSVLSHFIQKVRRYNVRIAIDDFGSGFSNLLEIARLSPNFIKIDGQIIREVLNSDMHHKIVGTILHLANEFNIDLVAEYIENEKLQDYASENGVRYSQGYYFSCAVPFEELDKIVNLYK